MTTNSTMQERLNEVKYYYKLSGRRLASVLGLSPATITNYLGGVKAPSYEFIMALLTTYPDISAEWLLRGEGPMLRTDQIDIEPLRKKYETEILVKDGIIKELRSIVLEKNQEEINPERKQLIG